MQPEADHSYSRIQANEYVSIALSDELAGGEDDGLTGTAGGAGPTTCAGRCRITVAASTRAERGGGWWTEGADGWLARKKKAWRGRQAEFDIVMFPWPKTRTLTSVP